MTSLEAATVTIERGYFDTLVRRAEFNKTSLQNNPSIPSVAISQAEYDSLKSISRQYENLRRNLLLGGVGEETVALLSQDDKTIQAGQSQASPSKAEATEDGGARLNTTTPQPTSGFYDKPSATSQSYQNGSRHTGHHAHGAGSRYQEQPAWADADGEVDEDGASCDGDSPIDGPPGATYVKSQNQRQQFDRECTRTIQLSNLADGTTHADITAAVRGGQLLDVFLRPHERSATVSFLHAVDARKFFEHVRRNDLYIKNKRVDIKWSERQFILPGHVAGKVATGASRNLVIRRYDGRHTEENIREDLDHIHNLVVVKVEFAGGSCYISLNSVHNAIYAQMCMMSRGKYKGTKIEWDIDECAQPYTTQQLAKPRKEMPPPKKALSAATNRFQLLNIDDDDDKEDEISSTFQSKKSVGIAA
ncbi:hypothetical protein B0H66DRAFT_361333 [Apodospora peruviana]|uniref:Negative regulator of differentiation 1 n=1 Tax=Apodospora peruviana TaxID=516989 RepID=A0AAE0HVQ6_9PEZI|nr:hypothetical protein B0H66DRAFT_361333 [Apodospora peruviana]